MNWGLLKVLEKNSLNMYWASLRWKLLQKLAKVQTAKRFSLWWRYFNPARTWSSIPTGESGVIYAGQGNCHNCSGGCSERKKNLWFQPDVPSPIRRGVQWGFCIHLNANTLWLSGGEIWDHQKKHVMHLHVHTCTRHSCSFSCTVAGFGNQEVIGREEGTLGSRVLGWTEQGVGDRTGFTFQMCHSVVKWLESLPNLSLVTLHSHTVLRITPISVAGPCVQVLLL